MEISCVVPAFETPVLLRVCLHSILRQQRVALELIVSDDSASSQVRDLIAADDVLAGRVLYLPGPRSGNPIDNWNLGLKASRAPACVLVHHDEHLIDRLYLRDALDRLNVPGVAAVVGAAEVIGVNRPSGFARARRLARLLGRPRWLLPSLNWIGPTAAFVFRGGPRFDPRFVQLADVEFYRRVLASGSVAFLDRRCVASLGHHEAQITARIDPLALAAAELSSMASGLELAVHHFLLRARPVLT